MGENLINFLKNYLPNSFQSNITNLNFNDLLNNLNNLGSKEQKNIYNDNKICIFNEASTNGLWYNWATNEGVNYTAISYSAGTTWILNQSLPIEPPEILIFKNKEINCSNSGNEPLYKIKLNNEQGIRSLLVIDDEENKNDPYCLIGTFEYPPIEKSESNNFNVKLLKWNFKSNKLVEILKITNDNSIRKIIRYKNYYKDIIFFSTQNDEFSNLESKLYWIEKYDVDNNGCKNKLNFITFNYKNKKINGSIWDFFIDCKTLYLSIPLASVDNDKITGFSIKARLYYFDIEELFTFFGFVVKKDIDVICLIGNKKYPPGFNVDSISTVQVVSNPKTDKVYIYTLSDFVYQFLSIARNPNLLNKILSVISSENNDSLFNIILAIRKIILGFDLEGTRIFEFSKNKLYGKNDIMFKTVVGSAPYDTINKSITQDGYNSWTNGYTWCATSYKDNFYFGTLDIRSEIYTSIVIILVQLLNNPPGLYEYLISLPEEQIIVITELLNPNFCVGNLEDLKDKKLYFDIININNSNVKKIISDGFNLSDKVNNFSDSGIRNLNIIDGCKGKYLLIGTTCYQLSNKSKNYLLEIKK